MRLATLPLILSLGLLSALAPAQAAFAPHGQYAQFRNMSGLPGGTFGVNPFGQPDSEGAMAMSTPIAYSLSGGHYASILANTSYDRRFRLYTGRSIKGDFGVKSNGTATIMAGGSTPIGDFTVGMSVVSGAFENSYSALFTPKQSGGKVKYAVGAEGLFSAGGFLGPGFHSDADRVISAFGVATVDLGDHVYASAGWGTSRFSRGFVNVSAGITTRIRAVVEHDGFNWNFGVGTEFGRVRIGGGKVRMNAFVGILQTRYAFWSVGLSF